MLILELTYLFLGRASEPYANSSRHIRRGFGVTRGDFSFFLGTAQLTVPALWRYADRLEVRLEGSKGDRKRFGAVASPEGSISCTAKIDWELKGAANEMQTIGLPLEAFARFDPCYS